MTKQRVHGGNYLLKTSRNAISKTLNFKMSLDASAVKSLYLWCKFQSHLLFIISLLLLNFLTALYQFAGQTVLLSISDCIHCISVETSPFQHYQCRLINKLTPVFYVSVLLLMIKWIPTKLLCHFINNKKTDTLKNWHQFDLYNNKSLKKLKWGKHNKIYDFFKLAQCYCQ